MKKFVIMLQILFTAISCSTENKETDAVVGVDLFPTMLFNSTSHDFGKIQDGDTVSHNFSFKNTGAIPLIIADISASCGCTAVEWPKQPILPDKSGNVRIQFSKSHDIGQHSKSVIVKSNIKSQYTVLNIKATIVK